MEIILGNIFISVIKNKFQVHIIIDYTITSRIYCPNFTFFHYSRKYYDDVLQWVITLFCAEYLYSILYEYNIMHMGFYRVTINSYIAKNGVTRCGGGVSGRHCDPSIVKYSKINVPII